MASEEADLWARIERLASARGETVDEVVRRFGEKALRRAPKSISKHASGLMGMGIAEAGVHEGLAYLRLPNGRVFYGFKSERKHRREYEFLEDRLPEELSAETYLVGLDVVSRYVTDHAWYPAEYVDCRGGVVVEVGAYLGHKTLRFVDGSVGPDGRVLAIEMMPKNAGILDLNMRANGAGDVVQVAPYGAWECNGSLEVHGVGRQRNSLVELDKLRSEVEATVSVYTMDELLARYGLGHVDFMVVTANGAEVEVLRGLDAWSSEVEKIYVAACYTREGGVATVRQCVDILEERGFLIDKVTRSNEIYAKR